MVILVVANATQARKEELTRIVQELQRAKEETQAAKERQDHHEGVSTRLHANIVEQGEVSASRTEAIEVGLVNLRAQYTQDV